MPYNRDPRRDRGGIMHRVTVALDGELLAAIDRIMEQKGYQSRSEAVRDLARAGIRQLAERLVQSFHDNHDLALATTHVHLDHDSCLEVTMLKGPTPEVQKIADRV